MKIPAKGFTHGGKFHADDVFSTALLQILRPDIQVTRGFVVPDDFDGIVYDVGGGMFDHHSEPRECRPNGVPYAAFGLLWRVLGAQLVGEHQARLLDENFIQPLDLNDNTGEQNSLADAIGSFNPLWDSKDDPDECFWRAVPVAKQILENEIAAANAVNRADDTVRRAYANMRDGIVVLPAYMPWKNGLYKTDAIFVVYPSQRGGYSAQCVNDHRTKRSKQPFPVAWVYLLRCPDGSLYGGWTNDLARRLKAHRSGKGGAKYTKSHGRDAVRLAYAEKCADKSAALKREAALKKLPKAEKEALAAKWAADNKITLRMATPDDAAAVCALYNWYVRHGVQTFQYTPSTVEEYRENIAHTLQNAPFLLAESADGRLQGFACAHLWHEREAYAWDVETTAYCAPDCIGQGVGGRLYRALIALLKKQGYYNAFALVTGSNCQSNNFHKALGFTQMGIEKRTGYKFGQWLDLDYWELPLQNGEGEPQPVRKQLTAEEIEDVLG